jgi:hypothetical protein
MRDQPELSKGAQIAAAICAANGLWTALLLCAFLIAETNCGDPATHAQACGGGLGIGVLWLLSEVLLGVPTIASGMTLFREWPETSRHPLGQTGLIGLGVVAGAFVLLLGALLLVS